MTTAATLIELQQGLQAHLLAEEPDLGPQGFLPQVAARHGISPARRLAIYHHAYRARLVEALRDSYGHTLRYLGDDWFDTEARAYLAVHPSEHANLRWFGNQFAFWLRQHHPQDGEIAELAQLDWALRRAFDGPDATPLTLHDLAQVPPDAWERIGFVFHPTLQCLHLQHNTLALWQALDQDDTPPAGVRLDETLQMVVWRRDLSPHFRSVDAFEAAALQSLQAGAGFAAACETLAASFVEHDVPSAAGGLLRRWSEEGWLVGLSGLPGTAGPCVEAAA